ncbi:MAG: hypothetical protein ABSG57_11195 [Candidatus Bathyarchaeia archaeon]
MSDTDEYRQLSALDQAYVSKYGWDSYHKKKQIEQNIQNWANQTRHPEPQEEEVEEEETEESEQDSEEEGTGEPEPQEEEQPLYMTEEQQREWKEEKLLDAKIEAVEKIKAKLDAEESTEKTTDDLIRFIKSDPSIEELTKGFLGLLLAFPRFPDVDRVTITIQRKNATVNFGFKAVDKNGKDVTFDSKTGNVVKVD